MNCKFLGNTKLEVSPICFGTLVIGPLQANFDIEKGAEIIAHAIDSGINFFDTAQLYETYGYLKRAIEITRKHDIVISSKTYAYTRELAIQAVEQARWELNRDVIDIFMLHEQESIYTLNGHKEALETLLEYKSKGIIKAVGASMHHIAAVYGAIEYNLDVIHPMLNIQGLGIADGTKNQMEQALKAAYDAGLGIFSMKPLGGGNLHKQADECLKYIFTRDYLHSVAIGMQSAAEVDANCEFYETGKFAESSLKLLQTQPRKLHIDSWCEACGKCVKRCGQNALHISNGQVVVNNKCVLCGYCSTVCEQWAIKIV